MRELKKKIEEFAAKEGIDLIGFADRSRFEGVDAQSNPFSIFPEAKTVILVGKGFAEAPCAELKREAISATISCSERTGWRMNSLRCPAII